MSWTSCTQTTAHGSPCASARGLNSPMYGALERHHRKHVRECVCARCERGVRGENIEKLNVPGWKPRNFNLLNFVGETSIIVPTSTFHETKQPNKGKNEFQAFKWKKGISSIYTQLLRQNSNFLTWMLESVSEKAVEWLLTAPECGL